MKRVSFDCYRRCITFIVSVVLVLSSVLCSVFSASATDSQETQEFQGYDASDSIVQVVLLYQDTNSVYHILQSGSGILVDNKTVITNNHLTYMSDALKTEAGAYLTEKLGYEVTFIPTEESNQNVATYSIAIVQEADIYNIASVQLNSNDWDFAILSLSSQSDKTPAVFGRSEYISLEQEVATVGLPTVNYNNAVSFTYQDVITTNGKCTNLDGGIITFDARLEPGSSGGALVDKYGRVVGITTYKDSVDGLYCALPVDNIKGYLERSGIVYTEDDRTIADIEIVTTEEIIVDIQTDKNELNRVIMEAELIYEEGNDGKYTEESFRNLRLHLDYAKNTFEDPYAPQTTIDSDTYNLREAIDGLKKIQKKSNVPLIVAISVGGVVLLTLIIILIVVLVKKAKRRKVEKKENEKIKTLPQTPINESVKVPELGFKEPEFKSAQSSKLYGTYGANESSATIMSVDVPGRIEATPGTTILTNYAKVTLNGYLYSTSTGKTIPVEGEEFLIGKAPELVNYVVNNATISRKHAKITRKYDEFFLEDLGSTNFTYLNSNRVAPRDKKKLQDRDVIYLSDEEFIFMIGN